MRVSRVTVAAMLMLCVATGAVAQTREAPTEFQRVEQERSTRAFQESSRQRHADGDQRLIRQRRAPVLGLLLSGDSHEGVRVVGVTPDGSAAEAGLRAGDRVTTIDGKKILGTSGELRLDNARRLLARLDVGRPVELGYLRAGTRATVTLKPRIGPRVVYLPGPGPCEGAHADSRGMPPCMPGDIRREVIRISPRECTGKDCKTPLLAEAFRWHGLNLASVDRSLGRYFGTERGVLVLSTGELAGLQPGDVIQKIDGKAVDSPREAMDVLHDKPADALVLVEYLRDRKVASTRVKVPKALPLRIPLPPPPPAAPAAPRAPAAPPPPPPPPAAASVDDVVILRDVRIAMAPEAMTLLLPPEAPLPPDAPEDIDVVIDTH